MLVSVGCANFFSFSTAALSAELPKFRAMTIDGFISASRELQMPQVGQLLQQMNDTELEAVAAAVLAAARPPRSVSQS